MTHEWKGGHAEPGLRADTQGVDRENGAFYGEFPYPWRPMNFVYPSDGRMAATMLAQAVGDFDHARLSIRPRIWIAGCGTNQATQLALDYPLAHITASDLSASSLELCRRTLDSMGMRNVVLRQESINDADYDAEFDIVVCTGVIHHNADPQACLARVAKALKPTGIAEVMVYNTFHRAMCVAFQESLRIIAAGDDLSWPERLALARRVGESLPAETPAAVHYASMRDDPDSRIADALMQPVERSYTVDSFYDLCHSAGMEPITYLVSEWDKARHRFAWNIPFDDPAIRARYRALPDRDRWQMCNLMLGELSPMLWFYVQRQDCPHTVLSEAQLDEAFLDRRFVPTDARRRSYRQTATGDYALSNTLLPPLPVPNDIPWEQIAPYIRENMTPREALSAAGLSPDPALVSRLRIQLTTPAFPFLSSVVSDAGRTVTAERAALA